MFEPKFLIQLDKKVFPFQEAVCLGSQLKSIINNLSKLIGPNVWFCADIDAISPIPEELGINSFRLKQIGYSPSLISLCENINQFLSGVFIAINEKNQKLECSNLWVGTEDEQFRSLDLEGVIIETRAFDTTYFELYSEDFLLIKKLSEIYKVEIEKK